MKHVIIDSINSNLNTAINLLKVMDSQNYNNCCVGPYHSSVGSHIRHVLDFFDCIIRGLDQNHIDLTDRKRDKRIASDIDFAINHIHHLQTTLTSYKGINTDYLVHVTDHLGKGKATVDYTLESILVQGNSHMTHHFANIGYILNQLGIVVEIEGFGYNPTTPIVKQEKA